MRRAELEARVYDIVARVKAGERVEDAAFELKAELPPIEKAARRIAGQANAAFGDPITWVIGIDEKTGVVTPPAFEKAQVIDQLRKRFDLGVMPELIHDLTVPLDDGGSLVVWHFDTEGAPFLVRNLDRLPGDVVEFEVPWREGTKVRTARRSDFLRILLPRAKVPSLDPLTATVYFDGGEPPRVILMAEIYLVPRMGRLTIPRHLVSAQFTFKGPKGDLKLRASCFAVDGDGAIVGPTVTQVAFEHPGTFTPKLNTDKISELGLDRARFDAFKHVEVSLRVGFEPGDRQAANTSFELKAVQPRQWKYVAARSIE